MKNIDIPYSDHDLILRAIKNARPIHHSPRKTRQSLVMSIFRTNRITSRAICIKYGFDPDQKIGALDLLSDNDYQENILQHNLNVINDSENYWK